jgi:hypothetical protein
VQGIFPVQIKIDLIGVIMTKLAVSLFLAGAALGTHQLFAQTQINHSNVTYIINTPGSYILTSNLTVTNPLDNAISINVPNVTVNLNGFSISRPLSCTRLGCSTSNIAYGIYSYANNTTVENGAISGFYYAVGINNGNIINLNISSSYIGISTVGAKVYNNSLTTCAGYGINANYGNISNNTIGDVGDNGIYALNATVANNHVAGAIIEGIVVSSGLASGNSILSSGTQDLLLLKDAVSVNNACTKGAC